MATTRDGYVSCSACGRKFTTGTIGTIHQGFGRRVCVPQRRWHNASEVKTVTFAIEKPLCEDCGGESKELPIKVNVHKQACDAWKGIDPTSELAKLTPYYLRATTTKKTVTATTPRIVVPSKIIKY